MRNRKLAFIFVSLLAFQSVCAWNGTGHMVIAAIAYRQLPLERQKVYSDLLQHHPDYPKWQSDHAQSLPETDLGLYLFMRASTWPDELRGKSLDENIQHREWHFIEIPLASSTVDVGSALHKKDNILTGIAQCESTLRDATKSPQERAISLSWLIHLIGDIHQPLHCSTLVNALYPSGDRGGNAISIKALSNGKTTNLHALWDGLLSGNSDDILGDPALAVKAIATIPTFSLDDISSISSNATPETWVQESCRLAYEKAYLSGKVMGGTRESPFILPKDYVSSAEGTAKTRAALAGYRIARFLGALSPSSAASGEGSPKSETGVVGQKDEKAEPTGNVLGRLLAKIEFLWRTPWTIVGSIISAYLVSLVALLVLAWYGRASFARKARLLSPSWLIAKATQLLLVAPGLGRRALFIGYRRRLAKLDAVRQTQTKYFGLPARFNGEPIGYDATGDTLCERLCAELGPQRPIVVAGKGGAGKSTLLTRFAALCLKDRLPDQLKHYLPIYLPALYYREDLLQALTAVLKERDGVNVTRDIVDNQLQSGQFLILCDGISEIEQEDKVKTISDVLRAAKSAEYKSCRFIIATRPVEGVFADTPLFELEPLTKDVLGRLIPRYNLGTAAKSQLTRQLQSFGDKPIEPLLFTMAVAESATEQISTTRASLYGRYFRTLLRISSNDNLSWKGWQDALENIAEWSLLKTGKRGVGLRHQDLVNHISREVEVGGIREGLVGRLNRLYRLAIKSELDLLDKLTSAGLLQDERRRRFAHDSFEEYFAASRVASLFDENNQWPSLDEWKGKEREFLEVIDFVAEIVDPGGLDAMLLSDLPLVWKEHLEGRKHK